MAMGTEATVSIAQRAPIQRESMLLDFRTRELRRGNTRVSLTGQPLEILRVLLERPGEVVDRKELFRQLWPNGTFVDFEHSLNAAIKRLRAALGDNAQNPRFLETVPRRGYRWIHASTLRRVRLAVLPFSADDSEEGFVGGLQDELFVDLGRCARLELTRGRSTHSPTQPDYFLEGSVRRYGARVRVGAWLIDARQQAQAWSDIYERHDSESPAVIEIAALISAAVVARLAPVTEIQSVTGRLSRAEREPPIRSGRISAVAR
jgi:DNA-binding winged helix-turn-helix (wHTH) protein